MWALWRRPKCCQVLYLVLKHSALLLPCSKCSVTLTKGMEWGGCRQSKLFKLQLSQWENFWHEGLSRILPRAAVLARIQAPCLFFMLLRVLWMIYDFICAVIELCLYRRCVGASHSGLLLCPCRNPAYLPLSIAEMGNLFSAKGRLDIYNIIRTSLHTQNSNLTFSQLYIYCISSAVCSCLGRARWHDFAGFIQLTDGTDILSPAL